MEHHFPTRINARYFSFGNPAAKNLLVVLHGYGQLASYFIKKFEFLDPDQYYVVAPEGIHRFYMNGTNGRVGASWMTKEDRETDIQNYVGMLDTLLSALKKERSFQRCILLGFSQGGATASRYMQSGQHHFDVFLLWAAVFPPDMKAGFSKNFSGSRNFLVFGTKDEYYSEENIVEETVRLKEAELNFEFRKFEGTHTIDKPTLEHILNEI